MNQINETQKYLTIKLIREVFEGNKNSFKELQKLGYTSTNIEKLVKKYRTKGICLSDI